MSSLNLDAISQRVAAAAEGPWLVVEDGTEAHIETAGGLPEGRMFIRRDSEPADRSDVEFIAASRSDIPFLLEMVGQSAAGPSDLQRIYEIESRAHAATPGPWQSFLESGGGLGGCSVISVRSDEYAPDIYVWRGSQIAPDADIEFIAHAREDVPMLIDEVKRRNGSGGDVGRPS